MKKILCLLSLSLALNGCIGLAVSAGTAVGASSLAYGNVKNEQIYYPHMNETQMKKSAKVVVYRTDKGGMSSILDVKANGKKYGKLPSNSYLIIYQENLKNNKIDLKITSNRHLKDKEIELNVKNGNIYYIDIDTVSMVGVGTIIAEEKEESKVPKKFLYNNLDK